MRISDWSSDVCSSDLDYPVYSQATRWRSKVRGAVAYPLCGAAHEARYRGRRVVERRTEWKDRKSVVEGKSVSVRVDLGGRRIIKKNTQKEKISKLKVTKCHTHSRPTN